MLTLWSSATNVASPLKRGRQQKENKLMGSPVMVGMYEIERLREKRAREKFRKPIKDLILKHRFADAEALCKLCNMELSDFGKEISQSL